MIDPDPGRPENRGDQRFCVAGWNIDDQIPNPPLADGLQVLADGVTCMPSTNGVPGSSTCHACLTNSCNWRRAFSASG